MQDGVRVAEAKQIQQMLQEQEGVANRLVAVRRLDLSVCDKSFAKEHEPPCKPDRNLTSAFESR